MVVVVMVVEQTDTYGLGYSWLPIIQSFRYQSKLRPFYDLTVSYVKYCGISKKY